MSLSQMGGMREILLRLSHTEEIIHLHNADIYGFHICSEAEVSPFHTQSDRREILAILKCAWIILSAGTGGNDMNVKDSARIGGYCGHFLHLCGCPGGGIVHKGSRMGDTPIRQDGIWAGFFADSPLG